MIFHSGIIALLLGSLLITVMLCSAAYECVRIIRNWKPHSGSELQLDFERKTYLISTLVTYALGFQLFSLFLFIYTADTVSSLFIGAMCAAGSLKVSVFGYPTVALKLINFLLAGLWVIVNVTDNKAYDYPLIKTKYVLLLCITPLLVVESFIQARYLLGLKPDMITSCCGTLFTGDATGIAAELIVLPHTLIQALFYATAVMTLALELYFYLKRKKAYLVSISSFIMFFVSFAAVISFISVYIYELPTHHCPFCILQREYGYVGYWIYLCILVGSVCGLGVGVIMPFRNVTSLINIVPAVQRKLCLISMISYATFVLISSYAILFSNLTMAAY